jgi:hypothetical protein
VTAHRINNAVLLDLATARELVGALDVMSKVPDFSEAAAVYRLRAELRRATGDYASGNARMPVPQWITDESAVQLRHDDLLDSGATAELLGITPNAVRDLRRRGRLAGERVGGRWTFRRSAVAALMASRGR